MLLTPPVRARLALSVSSLRFLLLPLLFAGTAYAEIEFRASSQPWCYGLPSAGRVDDSAARLVCGTCSGVPAPTPCVDSSDCPAGEPCVDPREELVWWDARLDAAVNDVRAVATRQDAFALYFKVELWILPDPVALPFAQLALDVGPGGSHDLIDPAGLVVAPGLCSGAPDRGCTEDADCHFCAASFELPACCDAGSCGAGETCRQRICGSGCNTEDTCDTSQTCEGLGTDSRARAGADSTPVTAADYLLALDFSRFLVGFEDTIQVNRWEDSWSEVATLDFVPVPFCCGDPEPSVELGIPWSVFGCMGWTDEAGCGTGATADACGCPDLGPGSDFAFSLAMMRTAFNLDYLPDGALEDVASEASAGSTTRTGDDCPQPGIASLFCEAADGSLDAFAPGRVSAPGGAVDGLRLDRPTAAGGDASLTLRWNPSCSSGDSDYALYQGNLLALPGYDHGSVLCSTGGATNAAIAVDSIDRYYLVVPTDGIRDGSYGSGFVSPRPAASAPCREPVDAPSCGRGRGVR